MAHFLQDREDDQSRKVFPYVVEFVKFTTGFAAIVATALLTLQAASASMN